MSNDNHHLNSAQSFGNFSESEAGSFEPLKPDLLLRGKYRLERKVGQGGMGEIWKARDIDSERDVVLKFVPKDIPHYETEMRRVKETFRTVQKLNHQYICPVYALEQDTFHGYYIVMKWLEGRTLDEFQRKNADKWGRLPTEFVPRLLEPVAKALDYAHKCGVIHRDVKPSNIFVNVKQKMIDEVNLIDFGLASEIRSSLSRVSMREINTSGTRPYMPPEQWRGRKQNAKTDQYSLAVVAYELYAGYLPFEGNDLGILREAVLNEPPEKIAEIPDKINAVLQKALSKDGEDRFDSCRDFVLALKNSRDQPMTTDSSKTPVSPPPFMNPKTLNGNIPLTYVNSAFPSSDSSVPPSAAPLPPVGVSSVPNTQRLTAVSDTPRPTTVSDTPLPPGGSGSAVGEIAKKRNFHISMRTASILGGALVLIVVGIVLCSSLYMKNRSLTESAEKNFQNAKEIQNKTAAFLSDLNALRDVSAADSQKVELDGLKSELNFDVHEISESIKRYEDMNNKESKTTISKVKAKVSNICMLSDDLYQAVNSAESLQTDQNRDLNDFVNSFKKKSAEFNEFIVQSKKKFDAGRLDAKENAELRRRIDLQEEFLTEAQKYPDNYHHYTQKISASLSQAQELNTARKKEITAADRLLTTIENICSKPLPKNIPPEAPKKPKPFPLQKEGEYAGQREEIILDGVKFPFRWCPSGEFNMGTASGKKEKNEIPHLVKLTKGFWILEIEVTQGMYQSVTGKNPSYFQENNFYKYYLEKLHTELEKTRNADERSLISNRISHIEENLRDSGTVDFPVENVSWKDAVAFCEKFNNLYDKSEYSCRLPTEAQWEYACRADQKKGNKQDETNIEYENGDFGHGRENVKKFENAICCGYPNADSLGFFIPYSELENNWGLVNMHGTVAEWCSDWDGEYDLTQTVDPTGPAAPGTPANRIIRGGHWQKNNTYDCAAARRYSNDPATFVEPTVGFRIIIGTDKPRNPAL